MIDEKQKERIKKWYLQNKEKRAKYSLEYQRKHSRKIADRQLARYHANKDKFRDMRMKIKFNLSLKEYNSLLKKQKNCCALCGEKEKENLYGFVKNLNIDHSHINEKIRGLLCGKCNRGLGSFNDDIKLLLKAIKYLKKYDKH